ncbi:DUF2807 domain-containing protein [Sphingobium sp. SCG-1]|uniref:GIN domain-containing protein n=1 Tax=Sphingobium sp. SCG-1 TaxID=2072936 RepID=UPI000CD691BA|nr:DUF2807 domain-containing protein [Sphingobium sp. SCG-1]AUW57208.1 DUF2807 domain-containing protein [Sphingobium sp. SCG-1]
MIRFAFLLPLLAASAPAAAATQGYTITRFDSIRVDAPVRVFVTTGMGVTAKGDGDRDALDRVDMQVSGNLLVIRMKPRRPEEKGGGGPVTLRLSTDDLRRATLTGGGSLTIDKMRGQRGDIMLGGGGDISIGAVALDQVSVLLSGAGRVTLAGKAGRADMRVSGPGVLTADALVSRDARLVNEGTGSISATASATADVSAFGSGDVLVQGKAACTVKHNGAGRVLCGGEER